MKNFWKISALGGMLCLFTWTPVLAQEKDKGELKIEGQLRPRAEYRHGFGSLANTHQESAFFVEQRTRLNTGFKRSDFELYLSIQDIRVWGDQPQLVRTAGNLTGIHQAWGKLHFGNKWSLKLGRQEISYDDERLFGAVDWAQQARSHDAAIVMYEDSTFSAHLGLAFNQDRPQSNTTLYTVNGNYKTMQFLWLHKDWKHFNLSALVLNLGMQVIPQAEDPSVHFNQTYGARLGWKKDRWKVYVASYYQGGEDSDTAGTTINAFQVALDANYALTDKWSLKAGGEILSGTAQNSTSNENNSFFPFFGTNHKFNGLMDYFYVGNHARNVGLNDYFLGVGYKLKKNSMKFGITAHTFYANQTVVDLSGQAMESHLGTELDFTAGMKLTRHSTIKFGYSHLFATDTMESLKGGDKDEVQNWAWVMINLQPYHIFKFNKK